MIIKGVMRQFSPLSMDIKSVIVMGVEKKYSPPFCIVKVNKEGRWTGTVDEVFSYEFGKPKDKTVAKFGDYGEACSAAKELLKDLKMTIEEDRIRKKTYPEKVFRLDDV